MSVEDESVVPNVAPLVLDPVELREAPLVLLELGFAAVSVEFKPLEAFEFGFVLADELLRLPLSAVLPLRLPELDVEPLWPEVLPVLP